MNERKKYEMTQADLDILIDASKPVPYMVFGGVEPLSPQQNANSAWANLGAKMGFDHMTVEPAIGGQRFFTAIPTNQLKTTPER